MRTAMRTIRAGRRKRRGTAISRDVSSGPRARLWKGADADERWTQGLPILRRLPPFELVRIREGTQKVVIRTE